MRIPLNLLWHLLCHLPFDVMSRRGLTIGDVLGSHFKRESLMIALNKQKHSGKCG